ncbi:MAG: hypothetical protein ACI8RA_001328 [Chlamydiales bacterium]|jgi:hypothetical protein
MTPRIPYDQWQNRDYYNSPPPAPSSIEIPAELYSKAVKLFQEIDSLISKAEEISKKKMLSL